jgi:hypothetical protein
VVDLQLEAMPAALRLFTNLEPATLTIDDGAPMEIQGGQLLLDRLPEGRHTLKLSSPQGTAAMTIEVTAAAQPRLAAPVEAKQVGAVVVSNFGGDARVYTSGAAVKAVLDGQPAGDISPDGLPLTKLAPGSHVLDIGEGKAFQKVSIEAGPAPSLTAFFNIDRETGTLVVVTGEDSVDVWLDGRKQRRATRAGQLRIPNLALKQYSVRVAKDGFQEVAAQSAEIRKGEDTRLVFELKPVPTQSAVIIEGALPGAEVRIDGAAAGSVAADGSFSIPNLKPGEHTVELRKAQHRPRVVTRDFPAGQTVRLGAAEVALEALPRTPEPAAPARAAAPPPAARPAPMGMEGWAEPAQWQPNSGWLSRRGGDYVLYRATPPGAFVFTVAALRGRRLRWVARYSGEKSHVLFEADDKNFYRRLVANGKTTELVKKAHNLPRTPNLTCTLRIVISPTRLEHRLHVGDSWVLLDEWNAPDGNFTSGPFGFLIRGRDEIGLSNFSFTPGP